MMRKVILFLALGSLLLVAAGCGGSKSSSGSSVTQSVEVGAPLKTVIESYFTQYYDSQKSLSYTAMSNSLLADNANTELNEAFREVLINQDKLLNTGMRIYQYQLDYRKCAVSGNTATIELKLNLDFEYQNAPSNSKSGVYGVNYTFTLQNNGSAWVIVGIDSDLDAFVAFKALVAEKNSLSAQVQTSVIEQAKANLIHQMTRMSQSSLMMQGASSGVSTVSDDSTAVNPTATAPTTITNSVYVSCKTYNYSATNAVNYAKAFALAAQSSRVFCTWTDADCTNFVSQCIWAGYVGYISASDSRTKMNNRSGMIYPDWFAGASNASSSDYAKNWVAVDELWAYITNNSKTAGPKAVGYNNGKVYTGVSAKDINVGDILQFSKGSATDYLHSVVVTRKNATVNSYNDIFVSYHSTDTLDGALSSVIAWAGGEKCFMRRLVPQSGCYMK